MKISWTNIILYETKVFGIKMRFLNKTIETDKMLIRN